MMLRWGSSTPLWKQCVKSFSRKLARDSHVFSPPFPAYMFAGIIADKSLEHIECLRWARGRTEWVEEKQPLFWVWVLWNSKRLPIRFRATQRCWLFALLWAQSTSERIESRWVPCPSLALHLHEQGMVCTGPVHFQGGSHRLDGTGPSVDTWSKIWWTSPCIQTLASKRTHQASGLGENSAIAHPSPEEQS